MASLLAPAPLAGTDIYERILTAPGGLVVLEHQDSASLIEQFRAIARNSGQSVYVWQRETGITNLREAHHAGIPGSQRLVNALRYVQQSIHFGIYLFARLPLPLSPSDTMLLRQLARAPAGHVRRVVLLDLPSGHTSIEDVAVRLSSQPLVAQRPRLRDGRWLL